jgi:hypothetical protein
MSYIILEKWIWITIGACILIMIAPYVVLWMILQMPEVLRPFFVGAIVISWGIAAGYKDWLMDAKKREKNSSRLPE